MVEFPSSTTIKNFDTFFDARAKTSWSVSNISGVSPPPSPQKKYCSGSVTGENRILKKIIKALHLYSKLGYLLSVAQFGIEFLKDFMFLGS